MFLGGVLAVELGVIVAFVVVGGATPLAWASPAVFGVGGLAALALGLRAYLHDRSWVEWQGIGWLLLVLMLAASALPLAAVADTQATVGPGGAISDLHSV